MRLDVLKGGRFRLGVLVVDTEARCGEPFSTAFSAR